MALDIPQWYLYLCKQLMEGVCQPLVYTTRLCVVVQRERGVNNHVASIYANTLTLQKWRHGTWHHCHCIAFNVHQKFISFKFFCKQKASICPHLVYLLFFLISLFFRWLCIQHGIGKEEMWLASLTSSQNVGDTVTHPLSTGYKSLSNV